MEKCVQRQRHDFYMKSHSKDKPANVPALMPSKEASIEKECVCQNKPKPKYWVKSNKGPGHKNKNKMNRNVNPKIKECP